MGQIKGFDGGQHTRHRTLWSIILLARGGSGYKRHYVFQDKLGGYVIDNLQLIQYSLGNITGTIENPAEEAWLDFFKNAHEYENIPMNSSKIMKMAYDRIEIKDLPVNIKDLYLKEEVSDENYSERFKEEHRKGLQKGIEKGREEGEHMNALKIVKSMKEDGVPLSTIAKYTGLGERDIKTL